MSQTIDREAGDKAKGFRLQKLRAAKLMLEALERTRNAFFYAAIEVVEDVSINIASENSSERYIEEDKNYDAEKNFTIFSDAVRNTLVSFFDIYTNQWQSSSGVILGFYTTAGIGKERKSVLDDGTKLSLPKESVLSLLQKKSVDLDLAILVRAIVVEEYQKQYKDKGISGNLETLKNCDPANIRDFLLAINWFFDQEDENALKESVLKLIRDSKYFNFKHAHKEEVILALIQERLDERQNMQSLVDRVVTISDLKLIFKQAESEERGDLLDPVWSQIRSIEADIKDKRNLEEKVVNVVPDYPVRKIRHLARIASRSKVEQNEGNKSFLALKYRVFEACEEYMCNSRYVQPSDAQALDKVLEELQSASTGCIAELKKDYSYSVSNEETVKGVIMDLVDSCFVSFEKNPDGK
jgi:hypothetical protein